MAVVLPILFALIAPPASAMTEDELREALKLDERAVLKAWPGVPDRTIVLRMSLHPDVTRPPGELRGEETYDRSLMVVKTSTGEVMQTLVDSDVYASEEIEHDGVAIDTANYALAPGHRAFGVRFGAGRRGCGEESSAMLQLFDVRGAKIEQVLALDVSTSSSTCDECGAYSRVDRTVAVGPGATKGYADLVVRSKRVASDAGRKVGGACRYAQKTSRNEFLVHFDGRAYSDLARAPF